MQLLLIKDFEGVSILAHVLPKLPKIQLLERDAKSLRLAIEGSSIVISQNGSNVTPKNATVEDVLTLNWTQFDFEEAKEILEARNLLIEGENKTSLRIRCLPQVAFCMVAENKQKSFVSQPI